MNKTLLAALALTLSSIVHAAPAETVQIKVRWEGGANGYPTADDITIVRKVGTPVRLEWVAEEGSGIVSIDMLTWDYNHEGMISDSKPNGAGWTAFDTVKGPGKAKYIITATHERFGERDSPDPEVTNDIPD